MPSGYGWLLLRALFALGAVCLLAFVALRFLGRRLHGGAAGEGLGRVVARLPLEPRRTLYVVEVAGRYLLVGAGDGGPPALLTELDAREVARYAARAPRPSFLEVLGGRLRAPRRAGTSAAGAPPAPGPLDAAAAGPGAGEREP